MKTFKIRFLDSISTIQIAFLKKSTEFDKKNSKQIVIYYESKTLYDEV